MIHNRFRLTLLTLVSLAAASFAQSDAFAQRNPRMKEPADAPIKFQLPPSPPLPVADALKTFKLPAGFHIEAVAVEPLVEDPVAMSFDESGRMWVVEMRGYMHDPFGKGEDQPIGRVKILEDTDGDSQMDKATVFLDGLYMPRAVLPVMGGAIVGEPPELAYWRDTNGDGKADEKTVLSTGYGVRGGQPEYQANSPTLDLDNWIYNTGHGFRYRFLRKKWVAEPSSGRGQWGLSQDDVGRLFFCSNSELARADLLPTQYFSRNPFNRTKSAANVGILADQQVWPSRPNPGVTRGFAPGMLRDDGRLNKATAACGNSVYRGGLFPPEFSGNLFVGEPAGNLVKRLLVTDNGGVLVAKNAYDGVDFLTSTDERFRPVNTSVGPDGALYIVDMYRGILQHAYYVTDYLIKNIEQRQLQNPIHLGRIYRVVPDGADAKIVRLPKDDSAALVKNLEDKNGWVRDTAQRLLVERNDGKSVAALNKMIAGGPNALGRLHALWTLDGMGRLDPATASKALGDADPAVRAAAIRLCEPQLVPATVESILPALVKLAGDPSSMVQLQLALSLSPSSSPKAEEAMATLLMSEVADRELMRDAVVSGLRGRELEFAERLLKHPGWAKPKPDRSAILATLARCVIAEARPSRVARLVELAAAEPEGSRRQLELMRGLAGVDAASAAAAARRARAIKLGKTPDEEPRVKLVYLDARPAALARLLESAKPEIAELAKTLEARLAWPDKPGVPPPPKIIPLTPPQQAQFDKGKIVYTNTCMGCHQPTGVGQAGLAPPLADSEWAQGPEARLVRAVLHGVAGPIAVSGVKYNLEMPGWNALSDDDLANVLTYIRREWEQNGSPISAETVKEIRDKTKDRTLPWSAEELLKVR